jgi:hypothetical protein
MPRITSEPRKLPRPRPAPTPPGGCSPSRRRRAHPSPARTMLLSAPSASPTAAIRSAGSNGAVSPPAPPPSSTARQSTIWWGGRSMQGGARGSWHPGPGACATNLLPRGEGYELPLARFRRLANPGAPAAPVASASPPPRPCLADVVLVRARIGEVHHQAPRTALLHVLAQAAPHHLIMARQESASSARAAGALCEGVPSSGSRAWCGWAAKGRQELRRGGLAAAQQAY